MDSLYRILLENEPLKEALGATEEDSHIYPFGVDGVKECLIYSISEISNNGVKRIRRLDVTAISKNYAQATMLLYLCQHALLTIGDTPMDTDILKVELNGGGSLYNAETNTYHVKGYFYSTERVR